MTRTTPFLLVVCTAGLLSAFGLNSGPMQAAEPQSESLTGSATARGDELLAKYFQRKTQQLADHCLADITSAEDWQARRGEYHRQLQEMLGLYPYPERTPLQPVRTGTVEHDDFIVEKLQFQSLPGLYVTANLYRPRQIEKPLPAILYVCGHASVKKNGVSFGNKTGYQHHGAWFARNGYVCLTIDTIQLGEIPGIHHGTYREGMWWWLNRGYTPAGVEAWNGIRALDYLETRDEVDAERIGVTGRSGGGAYTWWITALDERVKVAVPVAGITTLHNHIVDGCIEGHCDCMFQVNSYGWDYPLLAALVAPRPLLISNTDDDRIFPLDGVVDVYMQTRRIYRLLGHEDHIGLCIAPGPHKDTQQLRVQAFHWLNRFLKDEDPLIAMPAEKLFEPEELKVFETLPKDEKVTSVQEWFVPTQGDPPLPESSAEFAKQLQFWSVALSDSFKALPGDEVPTPLDVELTGTWTQGKYRLREFTFVSEKPYHLPLYIVDQPDQKPAGPATFEVLDQTGWTQCMQRLAGAFPDWNDGRFDADEDRPEWDGLTVYFAPRGIGPTRWTDDERERIHIQRRFALLGTSLDRVRIEDVIRAVEATRVALKQPATPVVLAGNASMSSAWALHAAAFLSGVTALELTDLPVDYSHGPYLLNVQKYLSLPRTLLLVASGGQTVTLQSHRPEERQRWEKVAEKAKALGIDSIEVAD